MPHEVGAVLFASIVTVAAAFGVMKALLRRGIVNRRTWLVLTVATMNAQQRGNTKLRAEHVALAMLHDAEIADELEARGVVLTDLYRDLEEIQPERGNAPTVLTERDVSRQLTILLTQVQPFTPFVPARPPRILDWILQHGPPRIRAVFEKHGIIAGAWRTKSSPRRDTKEPLPEAPETGPYRASERSTATTDVVIWNDHKTKIDFVVSLLRETFVIAEPYATTMMLTVARKGSAVVGTYERHEAERLANTATGLARASGYPLRVTAEDRAASSPRATKATSAR